MKTYRKNRRAMKDFHDFGRDLLNQFFLVNGLDFLKVSMDLDCSTDMVKVNLHFYDTRVAFWTFSIKRMSFTVDKFFRVIYSAYYTGGIISVKKIDIADFYKGCRNG